MKQYQVLLRNIDGTEKTVLIFAKNENDARAEGKKIEGIFEAVVLRVNKKGSPYYIYS